MLVVWAVGAAVTYIMLPVNWFMETIGFLAVFTEAMLGKLMTFNQPRFDFIEGFSPEKVCHSFLETTRTSQRTG